MRRRLIKQGAGGYTITLPIKWIKSNNLESLAEIDLIEEDNNLLIYAQKGKKEKGIELDSNKFDFRMVQNLLFQSYRLGYDLIKIKYNTKDQKAAIIEAIPLLIGLEIIEDKDNQCILQNIAEPEAEKFEVMLRRLFLQILEFEENIKLNLSNHQLNKEQVETFKLQIDKLTNYTRRTIIRNKIGGDRAYLLYSILSFISLIAHGYYYMCLYLIKKNKPILNQETKKILYSANELFKNCYDSFYMGKKEIMFRIATEKVELFEKSEQLLEKGKGIDQVILTYLREIIRLTQMCTTFTLGYKL